MLCFGSYDSPLGEIVLAGDEEALAGLWFVGQKHFGAGVAEEISVGGQGRETEAIRLAKRWLDQYFGGVVPDVEVPVRLVGTEFQHEVWRVLATIPYGETMTYGGVARRVGCLRGGEVSARTAGRPVTFSTRTVSARAVGNAVGRNKISLIIPCHRVIGADGSLTGYAGGVERKRRLLEVEGRI